MSLPTYYLNDMYFVWWVSHPIYKGWKVIGKVNVKIYYFYKNSFILQSHCLFYLSSLLPPNIRILL